MDSKDINSQSELDTSASTNLGPVVSPKREKFKGSTVLSRSPEPEHPEMGESSKVQTTKELTEPPGAQTSGAQGNSGLCSNAPQETETLQNLGTLSSPQNSPDNSASSSSASSSQRVSPKPPLPPKPASIRSLPGKSNKSEPPYRRAISLKDKSTKTKKCTDCSEKGSAVNIASHITTFTRNSEELRAVVQCSETSQAGASGTNIGLDNLGCSNHEDQNLLNQNYGLAMPAFASTPRATAIPGLFTRISASSLYNNSQFSSTQNLASDKGDSGLGVTSSPSSHDPDKTSSTAQNTGRSSNSTKSLNTTPRVVSATLKSGEQIFFTDDARKGQQAASVPNIVSGELKVETDSYDFMATSKDLLNDGIQQPPLIRPISAGQISVEDAVTCNSPSVSDSATVIRRLSAGSQKERNSETESKSFTLRSSDNVDAGSSGPAPSQAERNCGQLRFGPARQARERNVIVHSGVPAPNLLADGSVDLPGSVPPEPELASTSVPQTTEHSRACTPEEFSEMFEQIQEVEIPEERGALCTCPWWRFHWLIFYNRIRGLCGDTLWILNRIKSRFLSCLGRDGPSNLPL